MSEVRPRYGIDETAVSTAEAPDTGEFQRSDAVAYERTSELELLISGAVRTSLERPAPEPYQIPFWVERGIDR